jgi:hypothetical protein
MRIRWRRLIAMALAIVATIVLIRYGQQIWSFIGTVTDIGHGGRDERITGLLALGVLLAGSLTAIRLVLNAERKSQ